MCKGRAERELIGTSRALARCHRAADPAEMQIEVGRVDAGSPLLFWPSDSSIIGRQINAGEVCATMALRGWRIARGEECV